MAPPVTPGGKFRVLERHQFKGMDFEARVDFIRKITERFNVQHIGMDTTGLGQGVYQIVQKFYRERPGVPPRRDRRHGSEVVDLVNDFTAFEVLPYGTIEPSE